MEADKKKTVHIGGRTPQHLKDGIIDLVAGSLGNYL